MYLIIKLSIIKFYDKSFPLFHPCLAQPSSTGMGIEHGIFHYGVAARLRCPTILIQVTRADGGDTMDIWEEFSPLTQ